MKHAYMRAGRVCVTYTTAVFSSVTTPLRHAYIILLYTYIHTPIYYIIQYSALSHFSSALLSIALSTRACIRFMNYSWPKPRDAISFQTNSNVFTIHQHSVATVVYVFSRTRTPCTTSFETYLDMNLLRLIFYLIQIVTLKLTNSYRQTQKQDP